MSNINCAIGGSNSACDNSQNGCLKDHRGLTISWALFLSKVGNVLKKILKMSKKPPTVKGTVYPCVDSVDSALCISWLETVFT